MHECMRPFADAVYSDDIVIDHYRPGGRDPRRNLNIYQKKIAEGVRLDGRGKYYYGRELYYNKLYLEAACVLEDYLAGTDKWYVNAVEACSVLADCKLAMGDTDGSVAALCRSFCYAPPRAETVCKLGGLFRKRDDEQAAFWYLSALSCKAGTQGFTEPDCLDFIPYIELCGCYYAGRRRPREEVSRAGKGDKARSPFRHIQRTFLRGQMTDFPRVARRGQTKPPTGIIVILIVTLKTYKHKNGSEIFRSRFLRSSATCRARLPASVRRSGIARYFSL